MNLHPSCQFALAVIAITVLFLVAVWVTELADHAARTKRDTDLDLTDYQARYEQDLRRERAYDHEMED